MFSKVALLRRRRWGYDHGSGLVRISLKRRRNTPMANEHVRERLAGIRKMIMAQYEAGREMSSTSKGRERELFVDQLLKSALPPPFRVGDGDVTDVSGTMTGQLDLVVECFQWPSLPVIMGGSRLYMAEGVAAVVEVKSDVADQWKEVEETARKVKSLSRKYARMISGGKPPEALATIPVYAVGYAGWKKAETVEAKVSSGLVDGVLVLDTGIFSFAKNTGEPDSVTGDWSLLGFLRALHSATRNVTSALFDPGWYYAEDDEQADV